MNKSFFDDDDEDDTLGSPGRSSLQADFNSNRAASPRAYGAGPSKSARASSTTGGRQSSVTGAQANSSVRAYESTRGGSPTLEDILGEGSSHDGERNVQKLIRAWNNEMGAPELLKYPKRLVERLVKDLVHRKALVKEANQMVGEDEALYLQASLVATECMRTAHVLKSYQRCRIYKIEQFADFYLDQEDREDRLSPDELTHAEGYSEIRKRYMNDSGRDAFPSSLLNKDMPVLEPDLSQAVFVHVLRECGPVLLPDGELIPLAQGSQHMLRYSTIRSCLERGDVELM
ncbi:hypothetical protein BCR35DRAFT_305393 [Leucosporidium creatinivorum]|uniref:DNA replication complex GINS protein SLD5 n=1 Tax=Leucosporidium creatinivorum TaxID=106004 RepID=A0A1Y2F2Q6_9BASI|nr:hypothetical protein BCR35DRAFT_305393 [Leucosporidium creatinivorum]